MRVENTTTTNIQVAGTRRFPINYRRPRAAIARANRLASDALYAIDDTIQNHVIPPIRRGTNRLGRLVERGYQSSREIHNLDQAIESYRDSAESLGDWFHILGIRMYEVLDELEDYDLPDLFSPDRCITRYINPFDLAVGRIRMRSIYRDRCIDELSDDDDDDENTNPGPRNPPRSEDFPVPEPYTERTCVAYTKKGLYSSKRWKPLASQKGDFIGETNGNWNVEDKFLMWVGPGFYWDVWVNVISSGDREPWQPGYEKGWIAQYRLWGPSPYTGNMMIWKSLTGATALEGNLFSSGGGSSGRVIVESQDNAVLTIHECGEPPPLEQDDNRRRPPPNNEEEEDDMGCCRTVRQNNELLRRLYREMCSCEDIQAIVENVVTEVVPPIVNPSISYDSRELNFQALPVGLEGSQRLTPVNSGDITVNNNYQEALLDEIISTRDVLMSNIWNIYSFLFDIENEEMISYGEVWKDKFFASEPRPSIPDDIGGGTDPDNPGGSGSFGGGESGGAGAGNDYEPDPDNPDEGEDEEDKLPKICWLEVIPLIQSRLHVIDEVAWTNLMMTAEILCTGVSDDASDDCSNIIPLMPDERFAQIPVPTQLVLTFGTEYPTQKGSLWHMNIPSPSPAITTSGDAWNAYFEQFRFIRGGDVLVRIYWAGSKMWTGCYVKDEGEADKLVSFVASVATLEMTNIRISKGGRQVPPEEIEVRCVRAVYAELLPDRKVNQLFCFTPPNP